MASDRIMQAFMPKEVETREKIELVDKIRCFGDGIYLDFILGIEQYPISINIGYHDYLLEDYKIEDLKKSIENKMHWIYGMYLPDKDYYTEIDNHILQKIKKVVDKIVEGYRNTEKLIKELG